MEVQFADDDLRRLEVEPAYSGKGLSAALVRAFRMRMQSIRAAPDERSFYVSKSLRFEKPKGKRQGQCSMRLNDQYRLVIELIGTGQQKQVRIIAIEDYH